MTAYAKIHVGCKQLGIDEEDRRDLYERVTKKRSLTDMSPAEHSQVVDELKRLGFKPTSKASRKGLEGQYAKKLQALWIAAWNLGIVKNKSDNALLAFVKRQTGVDHTRFLRHKEDADKAIEALKAWMAREAGVDWSVDGLMQDWMRLPGAKIAFAQWTIIDRIEGTKTYEMFSPFCEGISNKSLWQFSETDWIPVMNALGRQIRDAK